MKAAELLADCGARLFVAKREHLRARKTWSWAILESSVMMSSVMRRGSIVFLARSDFEIENGNGFLRGHGAAADG